ncbi:hypothetical protein BU24DRAFT_266342 [Aaosphaeria arxii CBS 175.79]|uniref:Protein kinase domain-containing protein n=1 Tax=Aaosphaeria arxii CBS 175.79 TaxID=1450172 RepID=A0A6A5XG64_9PLEO|nr:uncharacterized protein BU24DRAFT_266342 [Aaosphaeria arxii CBS 175.79]KAF2011920.1 hypothetical protein BU24DRAFT_266342 [Aaosphaeria arxii CBS 175.79]
MENDSPASSSSTSSSEEEEELLSSTLRGHGCGIKSEFDKTPHQFMPEGKVENYITRDTVLAALDLTDPRKKERKEKKNEELVQFVLTKAMKIFAILVYTRLDRSASHLRKAMEFFKKKNWGDKNLPFRYRDGELVPKNAEKDKCEIWQQISSAGSVLAEEKGKTQSGTWRWDFCESQWMFLAPVFSTEEANHDLEEELILPFIKKHTDLHQGSFGLVSCYNIHENHLHDPSNPQSVGSRTIAVKEIKAEEDAEEVAKHWADEVGALQMMNQLNHSHIVRFITAFRRNTRGGQEHYLMFEWADHGNLRGLWKQDPSIKSTAQLVKDVIKQLWGLASALDRAHNLGKNNSSYRHGDLKPENILRFSGGGSIGTLKMGDWGEAKIHNINTELRPSKTTAKYGTRRYESPEVITGVRQSFLGQPRKRRSRLYDIWAMGCITLEFIVWLVYGRKKLDEFNRSIQGESGENSPFYQILEVDGKKVARVHDDAVRWMEYLEQEPACRIGSTALGDLLDLVKNSLLVVKLPRRLGSNLSRMDEQEGSQSLSHVAHTSLFTPKPSLRKDSFGSFSGSIIGSTTQPVTPVDLPSITVTLAETQEPERIPAPPEKEPEGPARCLATDFRTRLEHILGEDEDESYWHINQPQPLSALASANQPVTSNFNIERGESFTTNSVNKSKSSSAGLTAPTVEKVDYASPELDEDDWKYLVDTGFASKLIKSLGLKQSADSPDGQPFCSSCPSCNDFRSQLWTPGFSITYNVADLESRGSIPGCEVCGLLWRTCKRNSGRSSLTVQFNRVGSTLRMNSGGFPVLSMVRRPLRNIESINDIQIGFAELPTEGGFEHMEVVRQWLRDCDENHNPNICKPAEHICGSRDAKVRLPTRLIDVGTNGTVRLWETTAEDVGEWIALSHQWGPEPHFATYPNNVEEHKQGIEIGKLAATFRDAVRVTRALGHRYLWIDSICIIQGPDGDFEQEAKRMEDVYSGANCVIAASCSTDHFSGFFHQRNHRDIVNMRPEGKNDMPFAMCQTIDNFKEHVLEGALNRRGWVLQEHALARRTIFFTEHQTYFECGDGVRCETMGKMRNTQAALLGDPNFPQILSHAAVGERILRYQKLYSEYSRLGLSQSYQRPIAIEGLQQRLLRTMRVDGGFGVFDGDATRGLLRRSLLWCRGSDTESLSPIQFPTGGVPSWSWMAYTGGIDYLDIGFGTLDWEDIQSPWSRGGGQSIEGPPVLVAKARVYDPGAANESEGALVWDTPKSSLSQLSETLCVVMGKEKGSMPDQDKRHAVLVIKPKENTVTPSQPKDYVRIGTGFMPGKCIGPSFVKVNIH